MGLTPGQDRVLRAYLRTGHAVAAAAELGIATQSVRNQLAHAYARLGVDNALGAATRLGWLVVPPPGVSSRPVVTLRRVGLLDHGACRAIPADQQRPR